MPEKIVVGMSGGVDSSIALLLLKQQGWEPIGVSLKLAHWKHGSIAENACCTPEGIDIAKSVCKRLGVEHFVFDVSTDFEKKVLGYFKKELKNNRTPNPCVICNRYLKFEKLLEWAKKHNIQYVASGHYAKTRFNKNTKKYELLRPKDKTKDQTYGLCFLTQKQLSKIVFPLGNLTKKQVYSLAKNNGFEFFLKKKQSQDLCFVSGKDYPKFLEKEIGNTPGSIVDESGNVLGKHKGLHFYTIGQKRKLNLPGTFFVKSKKGNNIVVSRDREKVSQKELLLKPFNIVSGGSIKGKTVVKAKIRYTSQLANATLVREKNFLKIIFDKPQHAATPGQFCVCYKGNNCIGGGIID